MAIQNRRGIHTDFDATKMVAGEFAVVQSGDPNNTNGTSAYISFQNGSAKRLVLVEDLDTVVGLLGDLETTDKTSIVDAINELAEKSSILFGTSSTGGSTRDKVVTCADFEAVDGALIAITVSQDNTVTDARFNVNSTGAKSIYTNNDPTGDTSWLTKGTYLFVYNDVNGGHFTLIGATERIASDTAPAMDGTAAVGTSKKYAREDHVHPSDTTRATVTALNETNAQVTQLKEDLEFQTESKRLEFIKDGYITTNIEIGAVVSTTPTVSNTYSYCIAECKPFDLITINGRGGGAPRLWAFCDNDMKLINKSGAGLTANNLSISAPAGSAYVVINTETSMIGSCYVGRLAKTIVPIYKNTTELRQRYVDLSEGDVVVLCGYNTETDGMGAIYDIVSDNYAHNAPVGLSNGLYAVPRLGITQDNNKPSGDIDAFVRIAETYMQSGSSFVYASDAGGASYPTAFSDDFVLGTYYINCSTLSRLIMYGIDYANSKYGGGSNSHSQGFMAEIGMQPSFSSTKVDAAAQQAMWAAYNGYAYYPNSDFSNVRAGDLVFFSNRAYDDEPYRFKNIDHVAIFLGIDGTSQGGTKRVQFIGNNGDSSNRNIRTFFYTDSFEYLQKAVLCAGISKQPSHHDSVNIISEPYSPHTVTSGQTIYEWNTDIELQSFSYYTLVIETDIVNAVGFTAKVGNTSGTVFLDGYDMGWFYSPSTTSVFRIVTGDLNALSASQRKLFKLLRGAGASGSLTVNACKLYRGWV